MADRLNAALDKLLSVFEMLAEPLLAVFDILSPILNGIGQIVKYATAIGESFGGLTGIFMGLIPILSKAALIAKQILSAKEMIIDAKTALSKVNVAAAKAAADTSTGFAATLKAGFPENIPLLIAYAAQAASIISAIGKAVSKSKAAIGKASGGMVAGGGDSISQPSGIAANPPSSSPNFEIGTAPETQVDNNIIQTYVISGDITSSQEAESKLNSRRQISG